MKIRWSVGLLLLLLLLVPAGMAFADNGRRVVAEDETVRENVVITSESLVVNGTVEGEVTVFGGDAVINGDVEGSITVWGGEATINGQVEGDLVLFGGDLRIAADAEIDGECVVIGGSVDDARPAGESCVEVDREWSALGGVLGSINPVPPQPPDAPGMLQRFFYFLGDIGRSIGVGLTFGVLALAVGGLFPRQLDAVYQAIKERPIASGTVGLLSSVAFPSLFVLTMLLLAIIIIIGWILMPFVAISALIAFGGLLVLGWVAMGYIAGLWLRGRLRFGDTSAAVTAAVGTGLLTLFISLLGAINLDFISVMLTLILAGVGLGAAVLTKFGTRTYPPPAAAPKTPPTA